MGIYDEYRDSNANIRLSGNAEAAAAFIPTARKFAEVIQGKLDLGTNLGMYYKETVALDDNTTMNISLSPGVTNAMMQIEIISNLPPSPVPVRGKETAVTSDCPRLPLSQPGARMFTHLFGHDVLGKTFSNKTFTQVQSTKVKTPYIVPTLDQGAYCSVGEGFPGAGGEQFHDEVNLSRPFNILGKEVTRFYVHDHWLGFVSPNVFLSFSTSVVPLFMPCFCNYIGDIFTPDEDQLGPGNASALSMSKNWGGNNFCYPMRFLTAYLVEGRIVIFPEQPSSDIIESDDKGEIKEAPPDPVVREFALVNWTQLSRENEIVLLYASDKCPAAIGFFYGGSDGVRPTVLSGELTALGCNTVNASGAPRPCLSESSPGSNIFNNVAISHGPHIIGENRVAKAYVDAFESRFNNPGAFVDIRADDLVAGRAFWFELDDDGFPTGSGLHNGVIVNEVEKSAGSGDLVVNLGPLSARGVTPDIIVTLP